MNQSTWYGTTVQHTAISKKKEKVIHGIMLRDEESKI